MDQGSNGALTPDEAGAFAAQWAERHPTTVEDLARRLEIGSSEVQSLLNQSKGRLSMGKWASQKKPPAAKPTSPTTMTVAGVVGGLLLGSVLAFLLLPRDLAPDPSKSHPAYTPHSPELPPPSSGIAPMMPPAQVSMGAPRGPLTPNPAANPNAAGGAVATPGPGMRPGREVKPTHFVPNRAANAAIESRGIAIPDNLLVAIHTPTVNLVAKGKMTGQLASLTQLKAETIAHVLDALMTYALTQSPLLAAGQAAGESQTEVQVRVGSVYETQPIQWTDSNRANLEGMFKGERAVSSGSLLKIVLGDIQSKGTNIFPPAQQPGLVYSEISGNNALEAKGIHIPDDMKFSLQTPSLIVLAQGKTTGNTEAVGKVSPRDVATVIDGLISFTLTKSPLLKGKPPTAGAFNGWLILSCGSANKPLAINWYESNRQELEALFKSPSKGKASAFLTDFFSQVSKAGKLLFYPPQRSRAPVDTPGPGLG